MKRFFLQACPLNRKASTPDSAFLASFVFLPLFSSLFLFLNLPLFFSRSCCIGRFFCFLLLFFPWRIAVFDFFRNVLFEVFFCLVYVCCNPCCFLTKIIFYGYYRY